MSTLSLWNAALWVRAWILSLIRFLGGSSKEMGGRGRAAPRFATIEPLNMAARSARTRGADKTHLFSDNNGNVHISVYSYLR